MKCCGHHTRKVHAAWNGLHVHVVLLVLWHMQNPFDYLYRDHDIENMSDGYGLCLHASADCAGSSESLRSDA